MGVWNDDMTLDQFPADQLGVTGSGHYFTDGSTNFIWTPPGIDIIDNGGFTWWDKNDQGDTVVLMQLQVMDGAFPPEQTVVGLMDPSSGRGVTAFLDLGFAAPGKWTLGWTLQPSVGALQTAQAVYDNPNIVLPFILQLQFDPTTGDITAQVFEGSTIYALQSATIADAAALTQFIADAAAVAYYPMAMASIPVGSGHAHVQGFNYNIGSSTGTGGGGTGGGGTGGGGTGGGGTGQPPTSLASAIKAGDHQVGVLRH